MSNAGILHTGTLLESDMTQYDEVMNTNLKSQVMMAKTALPHLVKTKGKITNTIVLLLYIDTIQLLVSKFPFFQEIL